MTQWISQIAAAICEAILTQSKNTGQKSESIEHCQRFVVEQLFRAPAHLKVALKILTFCFGVSSIFFSAGLYTDLSLEQKRKELERWKRAPFKPCRELIRFYESLVLLGDEYSS